jgi:hypothetical protein
MSFRSRGGERGNVSSVHSLQPIWNLGTPQRTRRFLRAQGAMEYLMTYGWAILLIMIVGVAMWQLGIFNTGSTIPTTSTGFEALKPQLFNCMINSKAVPKWEAEGASGFSCQFFNTAGENIRIYNAEVKINGQYCSFISVAPNLYINCPICGSNHLFRRCSTPELCGTVENSEVCDGAPNRCLDINKDQTFSVAVHNGRFGCVPQSDYSESRWTWPDRCLCDDLVLGVPYTVSIELTYRINLGGVDVEKKSVGTIRMGSEQEYHR